MLKTLTLTATLAASLFAATSLSAFAASEPQGSFGSQKSTGSYGFTTPGVGTVVVANRSDCEQLKAMAASSDSHGDRYYIQQYFACIRR